MVTTQRRAAPPRPPHDERPPRPRRHRDRRQTETNLFAAVGALIARDGILAGVSLQEVAARAGVNRGQIYQMFGSRQALLRAALAALLSEQEPDRSAMRAKPFRERRSQMFSDMLGRRDLVRLEALLALDGDDDVHVFPEFARTRDDLARDVADGHLPPDADLPATQVATASVYLGYCLFREVFARDTAIPAEELDSRVRAAFEHMLDGLATTQRNT